ncbi:MAG TPA: helix-turn-helix transcriptional regulator [Polyangiaceae bacterium]
MPTINKSGEKTNKTFAKRIRITREKMGLTQEQLGKLLGISGARVSDYELMRKSPDMRTLAKMGKKLKVSLDWLLGVFE